MGLDMYLSKRTYIGNKYREPAQQVKVVVPKNQEGVTFPTGKIDNKRVQYIIEEVGYWRKANAIHNWFVQNVQDGVDDCKDYYVSQDDLKELLADVNKVLESSKLIDGKIYNGKQFKDGKVEILKTDGKLIEDSSVAKEILPSQSGLFFGSTDYDQYYIEDLKYTKELIEGLLESDPDGEYLYCSSW